MFLGKFQLQPIAALGENIIDSINDAYFNSISIKSKDEIKQDLSRSRELFKQWQSLINPKLSVA